MDQYFESYEELDVHYLMLNDKPRILAYRNAIFNSEDKFKNRIIMDIGAGTGILSVLCAQAGAKKVYAVEASKLANIAAEVFIENKVQDIIKIFHNRVEDLDPNDIGKVDVIISEWMGFYLVHEGMLESILFARNHFLNEEGILFPTIAKLYASPCQLPSMFEFWNDIFGVSMKCIGKQYRQTKAIKPEILSLNQNDLLSTGKLLSWLDLQCINSEEINVLGGEDYVFVCKKSGRYQGVCIWFSVEFPDGSELSTGPFTEPTHWKQTVLVLPTDIEVDKDEPIAFKLELKKNCLHPRQYNIEMTSLDAAELEHDIPCNCHLTKCIVTRSYIEEHTNNKIKD